MTKADKSRPSTQVYQYVSLQVSQECMFASIKVTMYPKKASTQVSQVCKYASIPCMYIRMYVSTQVCKYASMQVSEYQEYSSIQSRPVSGVLPHPCFPKILAKTRFVLESLAEAKNPGQDNNFWGFCL